jgi:hypothetical protein
VSGGGSAVELKHPYGRCSCHRCDFLLHAYDQNFASMTRSLNFVWQSIAVAVTATAGIVVADATELSGSTLDWVVVVLLLTVVWFQAQVLDAGFWYNRNLVIVANIERQFLDATDAKAIHYYWAMYRPARLIVHLRIMFVFGLVLEVAVLGFHWSQRDLEVGLPEQSVVATEQFPGVVAVAGAVLISFLWNWYRRRYQHMSSAFAELQITEALKEQLDGDAEHQPRGLGRLRRGTAR